MMRPGVLTVCIVFASASAAAQAQQAAAFAELGPAQIRAVLSGKYVTDDHHSAHHQGRVKPGRWVVRDKQLCLTMPETGRQPECFAVHRQGKLQYRCRRSRPGGVERRAVTAPSPASLNCAGLEVATCQ